MAVVGKGNVVLNLLNVVRDGRNILGWFGKISRRWEQAEGGTENHFSRGLPCRGIHGVVHGHLHMDECWNI